MKHRRKKLFTLQNAEPLKRYILKDTEVEKETLIHRCAGEIDYPLLQSLKMIPFDAAYRNEKDQIYFI